MDNNKKELSIQEKIRLIQKENISSSEKQKKISELFKNQNKNNLKKLNQNEFDCKHYERKCSLYSPCCNKLVMCRLCHDEKNLCDKKFDRFKVSQIRCNECLTDQKPSNKCIKCNINFSKSFCNICNLWTSALISHCNDCGICRVLNSEEDEIFHCKICDACYHLKDKDSHKCIAKKISSREDKCPVCLIKLHDSVKSTMFMICGHNIHLECYQNYVNSGKYNCPICKKSLFDMKNHWDYLRTIKANINIPDEYKDIKVNISCFDCEKKTETEYCIDKLLECKNCGGFNTQKI